MSHLPYQSLKNKVVHKILHPNYLHNFIVSCLTLIHQQSDHPSKISIITQNIPIFNRAASPAAYKTSSTTSAISQIRPSDVSSLIRLFVALGSSLPPTLAIKVNLKKLAPAFHSPCFYPWSNPGESMIPFMASQHTMSSSCQVTTPLSPPHSSYLQTKQLQPGQPPTSLEPPADEATPARSGTQEPCQCMPSTTPETKLSSLPPGGSYISPGGSYTSLV
jgi:hypothetical protein